MANVLVLGELKLEANGRVLARIESRRARSLLGWLAVHPGLHPRERVAAVFWPDVLDASARTSLRTTLATLKRELGDAGASVVTATRDRVGIAVGSEVWIDLDAFQKLVAGGDLEQATALCRGGPLAGDAIWEDLKLGMHHPASMERAAIVTDARWARPAVKLFSVLWPGQARAFPLAEFEAAKRWAAESTSG